MLPIDFERQRAADEDPRNGAAENFSYLSLAARASHPENTVVRVGQVRLGDGFVVMAGPCAVESERQMLETAEGVARAGARMLRGGAFKPRTSPYSFQGLGVEGLKLLAKARAHTGLPVVSEAMSAAQVPLVAEYADMVQIGMRSMENFDLLDEVGRCGRPILLKRGAGATVREWLLAAEFLLARCAAGVVLCERGIRTFDHATRYTLDVTAVILARRYTHLPVIVDPSHACGARELVPAFGPVAVAAGAHGLLLEVHCRPDRALSDAAQCLSLDTFARMIDDLDPWLAASRPERYAAAR